MKKIKLLALTAAALFVLSSCASVRETEITLADAVEVKYDTAVVVRKDLSQRKQYEAYVKATVEPIAFENRSGILKKFHVALGDLVKEGDPIAEMDVSALEEQIRTARDNLTYKKKKLAFDLEQKQYDIDIAQIDLDSLKANNAPQSDIKLAELALKKLKSELGYIKQNGAMDVGQAEKSFSALEASLDGSVITAPCDGEVVSLEALSPGDRVTAYKPVAHIADNSRLFVQYDGTESLSSGDRTAALIAGKEYDLNAETYDPQEYLALVLAGKKPPARFTLVNQSDAIRAGDFAALIVYIKEKSDVLQIPVNSLYYNAGVSYVYRMEDGQKVYTPVTYGIRNDSFVEITSGLEEGDEVFVKQ